MSKFIKLQIFIFMMIFTLSSCVRDVSVSDNSDIQEQNIQEQNIQEQNIEELQTNIIDDVKDIEEDVSDEVIEEVIEITTEEIIREQVANMTLEEKIGQMFIVQPEVFSNGVTVTNIDGLNMEKVAQYKVGGFVLFKDNILDPNQIIKFNSDLYNSYEDIKPFIAVDEEGGQVARIGNNPNFPEEKQEYASTLGARLDYDGAYKLGDYIGSYLLKYGFNLDFAPVCDLLLNDDNKVVKYRSFGSDPFVVSDMTSNVLKGLHNNNILASSKHFPGHGSTTGDTHNGFATSYSTLEDMKEGELIPFKTLIEQGIDMVMISHVIYPNLSKDEIPATLNYSIITSLLKEDMNFQGVIITDAMNMGAIVNNYSVEEATIMAVKAGVDIVLMPKDFFVAYNALLKAVEKGEISVEQIDESVYKILELKYEFK